MNMPDPWWGKKNLSARDTALLKQARITLESNVATQESAGADDPFPWAPLRGIQPSLSGYNGVWNWDAAFHAIAVSRWDGELARDQIRIFLEAQLPHGGLPDVLFRNGRIVTDFGKPPVLPWACVQGHRRCPDLHFLEQAYRHFRHFEQFWREHRGGAEEGLFQYDSANTDPAKRAHDAKLESGWDDSVRFDQESHGLWPVDLNCYMILLYQAMTWMAQEIRQPDEARTWQNRAKTLADLVQEKLWNPQTGFYHDAFRRDGSFSPTLSPAGFMPLFTGFAEGEQAQALTRYAADPRHFYPGVPTVSYSDPQFQPAGNGPTWRGATWFNVAFFMLRGLKTYGFHQIADACREQLLDWAAADLQLYERYNSRTGEPGGVRNFGWTAAFVIEFVLNWDNTDQLALTQSA